MKERGFVGLLGVLLPTSASSHRLQLAIRKSLTLSQILQGRVTANGRVGATAAVYTAAILGTSACVPGYQCNAVAAGSAVLKYFDFCWTLKARLYVILYFTTRRIPDR